MKKVAKILLWIVGIVLALLILLSLIGGPIAKNYVNHHGEDITGRHVHVDHVGLNLFSGNVCVRGLAIYEEDGKTVFAGFDTLDVSAHLLKIPFHTLHFKHITLAGLHAGIEQQGERFNFSSLLDHFAPDSTKEQDTTPSNWAMRFYNIRISHARFDYNDLTSGKNWHLPDVNLRVPGFVLDGDDSSEGGLHIGFDKGGDLYVDANYDMQQSAFTVDVKLKDFKIANIESLLADMLEEATLDGTAAAHLTARGRIDEIMHSRIGGTVDISNIALSSEEAQIAAFETLKVKINNINLGTNSFDIDEVHLSGLSARYEQWEDGSNLSRILRTTEEPAETVTLQTTVDEPAPAKTSTGKPMRIHVGTLRVDNTTATYVDHTMPDPFDFTISNLSVSADNLSTDGDNNAMVRATLPGGGHLMLRWNGNIDQWKLHQDLSLAVKGLDMRQLSPLAVAYTGQPIEDGIFGLTTRLSIDNSQLDNQNKIDIFKAKVGNRRKDVDPEIKVPLKTALYILKDKDDKILIDLPVTGNIDSPEFNYMKLVWKTLGNLLVKVATSPARALAGVLGMGGDDLEFMPVDPSQFSLTSEQYHTLADLATIAGTDSLLVLTFEQRMPKAQNDTVARRYEILNRQVATYLQEQGLGEDRLRITSTTVDEDEKTGYAIGSEIKIEE